MRSPDERSDSMPSPTDVAPVQMPLPAVQGDAASMDGTGIPLFVSPERDLFAKPGSDQDSWFWVANLTHPHGALNVLVHFLGIAAASEQGMLNVMVSVLDPQTKTYVSEEQSFPIARCSMSADAFAVVSPIASGTGEGTTSHVVGHWDGAGVALDLTFRQTGPVLANMATGLFPLLGDINYHYAFPTMTATGTITLDGRTLEVSGPSWLDRQWGMTPRFFTPTPKKWIWFGVMLDNGDRISVWDVIENGRQHAFATVVHPDGGHEVVAVEPTEATASDPWTSPRTGHVYPSVWDVRIPQLDARLLLDAQVKEQEFVSPSGAHKYEASASVTGTMHGEPVTGTVMIELVGDWM